MTKKFGTCVIFLSITFILFVVLPKGLESLYCFKCLALQCPGDEEACRITREYIVKQMRNFYYIDSYLPECPLPDDDLKWITYQFSAKPCSESRAGEATCALGRMRTATNPESNFDSKIISHATIMGCAKRELLMTIKNSQNLNRCDKFFLNGTSSTFTKDKYFVSLEIEHCPRLSDWCVEDFCVGQHESVVKDFKDGKFQHAGAQGFGYGSVIVIFTLVLIIIVAISAASFCKNPLNRASNYSPTMTKNDDPILENHVRRSSGCESPSQTDTTEVDVEIGSTPPPTTV